MLRFALAAVAALFLAGCTPSETACLIVDEVKLTFDDFAVEGEFSVQEVVTVNAIYAEANRVCTAPAGTFDQAAVIRTAGSAARTIRKIMAHNDVAYQVAKPQLDKLERLLEEARQ